MSWFDATGFANLAKSALKEAQKTIDKALDIKDEEQRSIETHAEDTTDFFASWGLKNEGEIKRHDKNKDLKQDGTSSIWGSFTGSFFESPKFGEGNMSKRVSHSKSLQSTSIVEVPKPKLVSSASLPEDYASQTSTEPSAQDQSMLEEDDVEVESGNKDEHVPRESDDVDPSHAPHPENAKHFDVATNVLPKDVVEGSDSDADDCTETSNVVTSSLDECDVGGTNDKKEEGDAESKKEELNLGCTTNKMLVVSSESDKKSLESVEILGSRSNTDCTTTPESDGNSVSDSPSPSAAGPKVNSESVEILPDSVVTSPSSVEILGDWKSDSSPYSSPIEPKRSESSSTVDRDDTATPCWEDVVVPRMANDCNRLHLSSSDISPYESPMEEIETPDANASCNDIDRASLLRAYPCSRSARRLSGGRDVKVSPESVEVIPDTDELDEASLAEDSYTSASESTVMTILETFQQFEQTKGKVDIPPSGKVHDSCAETRQITTAKACIESNVAHPNLSLDSPKEKHNLHLPIDAITTQPIRKSEILEGGASKKSDIHRSNFDRLLSATIEPAEPDNYNDCGMGVHAFKPDAPESTEQYFMSTDSSCEGTLIESGSEDNPPLVHKADGKAPETPLTASSYVKNMLADAMVEKSSEIVDGEGHGADMPRENSPISSESRSDLVKIGSDQTSGHTSGDELETTTSSDIEIISSPNGDSSSTQSRQSPAKLQSAKASDLLTKTLKTRGHSRELSEISIGSDEANLEIEKLLKRIQEMTEILEARESKLIDVSRMNMELHEQNNTLKKQLDSFEKHAEQNQNLNQITDEYTQRLSALERKFQQAIRERDSLRKNLEQLKVEAATRLSSQEMSSLSAEKDEIIRELREEGEKLSKQQLQHSNIIKKLRTKERENDAIMKNQKEQIDEQISELERLKRSLHAKEEVERTQIEAVHTLTAKSKKQEKEILTLQESLDNTLHKMDAYKTSLDAAKLDLTETKNILTATEAELKEATNNAGESCQLLAQVEELKAKLRRSEEMHAKKEEFLKHENGQLLKRLETAETRSEELSESVSIATKPLLRQLEQLQANLLHKSNCFMKQEKALSEKNVELQTKIENLIEMDRYLKEENVNLKSKVSHLEAKVAAKEAERTRLQESYGELQTQNKTLVEQNAHHQQTMETLQQSYSCEMKELRREICALENKLAIEKAATDAERRKNSAILEQQQSLEDELRLSPTISIGRESVSSVNSIWPVLNDSAIESNSGRYAMVYDSVRAGSSSTSIFENLQAQLKQRDGEIQQLQWELSRRNTERDALNTELSTLTLKIEDLNNKVSQAQALNESLSEIQTRYDALLQMYGEKMEENQELRLDLEDIKEMYKTQIDQLLKRDT